MTRDDRGRSAPHLHIQAQTLPIAIGDIRATDLPQMVRTLRTYDSFSSGVA